MKANEFGDMSMAQLQDKVKELKAELFTLRFQLATGQLQDTMTIQNVRRDIARAKTVLHQLELKAQLQAQVEELKAQLTALRSQLANDQSRNAMTIQNVKDDIAKIEAALRQLDSEDQLQDQVKKLKAGFSTLHSQLAGDQSRIIRSIQNMKRDIAKVETTLLPLEFKGPLQDQVKELKAEFSTLRSQLASDQSQNTKTIQNTIGDIARVDTALRQLDKAQA